jgi:hypothetical protein
MAMNFKQLRVGELLALAGAILVIVSLFVRSYQAPTGNLTAWNTFGPGVALLLAAACAGLATAVSALTERSTALPVSIAVWSVLLGLIAAIAAVVRALERPDHASMACIGVWLALAGAVAILVGATNDRRSTGPLRLSLARGRSVPSPLRAGLRCRSSAGVAEPCDQRCNMRRLRIRLPVASISNHGG